MKWSAIVLYVLKQTADECYLLMPLLWNFDGSLFFPKLPKSHYFLRVNTKHLY